MKYNIVFPFKFQLFCPHIGSALLKRLKRKNEGATNPMND